MISSHSSSERNARKPVRNKRAKQQKAAPEYKDRGRFFIKLVGLCCLMLWGLLWSRFYTIQVSDAAEYASRAQRQHNAAEVISGPRGKILDRKGNILATTVQSYSVSARPGRIADMTKTVRFLSRTLSLPDNKVKAQLKSDKPFVWVARKVSDRAAKAVEEAALPGIELHREYERVYPYKGLAGQLIGFAGMDNDGLAGLEAALDDKLSGREMRRVVQRDARGGRLSLAGRAHDEHLAGQDVRLTLDINVQFFAETAVAKAVEEQRASWGGCMVVDVKSGDILAWAQYPSFNPNIYKKASKDLRRNRLAQDALEQGSTIKPFLVAAALDKNVITPDTVLDCENGKWKLGSRTIRDTKPHKDLSVAQILRYSSNIGVAKISLELGAKNYGRYLTGLGFGQRTGLPLGGENPGILRNPEKWPKTDLASASFGQSFSATPLQMAQAYLCLLSGGERKPLQIMRNKDLRVASKAERVFSPDVCADMLEMLEGVVQEDDGSGRFARVPGITVGGKTGTSQKAENGVYGDKRVASFVGFAPAQDPEYLILVVVDEPKQVQYGSVVAAPIFQQVLSNTLAYLGKVPDPEDPSILNMVRQGEMEMDPASYAQLSARADAENRTRAIIAAAQEEEIEPAAAPEVYGQVSSVDYSDGDYVAALPDEVQSSLSRNQVPDLTGMSTRRAIEFFVYNGVMPELKGQGGIVVRQSPAPGAPWPVPHTQPVTLWLDKGTL